MTDPAPVNELANRGEAGLPMEVQVSPMGLMQMLVEKGKDINPAALPGMLKELVALQHMVEDRNAAKEFAAAVKAFHDECPAIPKNKKVSPVSQTEGKGFSFSYADLRQIVSIVRPILAKHGLSFTYDSDEAAGKVKVTCILKHTNGHRETASYTALDTGGSMNASQKHTGAFTTARRLSLVAVLGLIDTDDEPNPTELGLMRPITQAQHETIMSILSELGLQEGGFAAIFGIRQMKELPALKFADAMRMLDSKKRAKGGAKP